MQKADPYLNVDPGTIGPFSMVGSSLPRMVTSRPGPGSLRALY
ncbi:MAG: hypothetical protein ACLVKA_03290 [Collinsella aerofaciens]